MGRNTALKQATTMELEGADIIDIGGESSRPGASPVSEQQELDRVIPVIEAVSKAVSIPISIDSTKPAVMELAIAAGAGFINDIYALRAEGALAIAQSLKVPICLMHMQGTPHSMQDSPRYGSVVDEVYQFLQKRIQNAIEAGIDASNILIDPGFGFGKTTTHNIELLTSLNRFRELGTPVLAGLSRKSMIEKLLQIPMSQRQTASVALALIAAQNGANIVRVHNVRATRDAIRIWECISDQKEKLG